MRTAAREDRQKILALFDAALLKMTAIRDKMASMESFNEVIELLRSIIKQQQQLRNETIEERNKRLKDLLN
jgi:cell shape-determining protein MreC